MTCKRILCAVDFSPDSVKAFWTAVAFARWSRATLHVLHCMNAPPVEDDAMMSVELTATRAMEALVATAAEASDGVPLTTEITSGTPFAEIVDRARRSDTDLIVLGGQGVTLLEAGVIGGTASQVVTHAACSVLIVRGPDSP